MTENPDDKKIDEQPEGEEEEKKEGDEENPDGAPEEKMGEEAEMEQQEGELPEPAEDNADIVEVGVEPVDEMDNDD